MLELQFQKLPLYFPQHYGPTQGLAGDAWYEIGNVRRLHFDAKLQRIRSIGIPVGPFTFSLKSLELLQSPSVLPQETEDDEGALRSCCSVEKFLTFPIFSLSPEIHTNGASRIRHPQRGSKSLIPLSLQSTIIMDFLLFSGRRKPIRGRGFMFLYYRNRICIQNYCSNQW